MTDAKTLSLEADEGGRAIEIHLELEDGDALLEIRTRRQDVHQHCERIIPDEALLTLAEIFAPWVGAGDLEERAALRQLSKRCRLGVAIEPYSADRAWLHIYFLLPQPCCDEVEHNPVFLMAVSSEDLDRLGHFFTDAACEVAMAGVECVPES